MEEYIILRNRLRNLLEKTMDSTLDYIVKKYDLTIGKGVPITIPMLSREKIALLFSELGFSRGVEIGVQAGKFSKVLCNANPTMEFYGIDPYLEYSDVGIPGEQIGQDQGYEIAKANFPTNGTLIRKKSMDAVNDFPDNYFDFVYVDGNHIFTYAVDDIHYWLKKIKVGGIIAGHDYRPYYPRSFIHVYQVVNAYTNAYGIRPWFVTDYDAEKVRSFFWVKQ